MTYSVKLYFIMLAVFFAIDMVWLGLAATNFYLKQIGHLMASSPNWAAAILFYLLFVFGILFFVVLPGLEAQSLKVVAMRGVIYGLITYATYDLTNLATLRDWPLTLTLVDMTWGMFLSVAVSLVGYVAGRWLG